MDTYVSETVRSEVLKKFADGSEVADMVEYSLPIFAITNEATFSTLRQYLIGSNTKEFKQSPRDGIIFF